MFGLFRKTTIASLPIVVPTEEQKRARLDGLAKAMSEDFIRLVVDGTQIDALCESLRSAGDLVVHAYLENGSGNQKLTRAAGAVPWSLRA